MIFEDKLYKNALINEKLAKFSPEERQKIILELLKTRSERQLAEEIGIPHSTIHDWKSLRQDNSEEGKHVSLNMIYYKLKHLDTSNFKDWGRLEQIKTICEELLRTRG